MKLPKGKIDETINGGIDTLKTKMEDFKSNNFSGYLAILKTDDEGEHQGQIVFSDGEPVLTEFLSPGKTVSGNNSIIPIIEISIDEDSKIEVHTAIDVNLMIKFFSKAKIDPSEFDVEKKLEEIKELEQKEREKAELLKRELEERRELEEQLSNWKQDGYVVTKLEKIFSDDLEKVKDAFREFSEKIKKLSELDERLSSIESDEFKSQINEIESMLNDPDNISKIEKEITNLDQMMSEQTQRREELLKVVNEWRDEGYNVAQLIDLIETDVNKAWDEFTGIMDTIQKLKEYEEMVNKIKTKGFEDKFEAILTKLKDVTALDDVIEDYSRLDEMIKEDEEKKSKLKVTVDEWENSGYKVSGLKDIFDNPFSVVEEKFLEYEKGIKQLEEIKSRLENFNIPELEEDIKSLSGKLNDLDAIEELVAAVSELDTKTEEIKTKKEGLKTLLEDLKEQGFNVSELEEVMDKKLDDIMAKFESFENKKKQLKEIEVELQEMTLMDFPEEAEQIKIKLKDPAALEEINTMLSELKEKVKVNEGERNEIKSKIHELSEEGFVITKIENHYNETLEKFQEEFINFLDEIQKLKDLHEELSSQDVTGYSEEINALSDRLKDPASLPGIEDEVKGLVGKIVQEKERREEIKTKIKTWQDEGFEISDVDDLFDKPLPEQEQRLTSLENDISKLKTIEEQINALDIKWHEEKANNIIEKLKNPSALSEIESALAELLEALDSEQRKRKELKDQLERWREEGYNVAMMDNIMDQHVDKISEAAIGLNEKINNLKDLEERFSGIDTKWFEGDAEAISGKIKDPDKVEEVEKEIEELQTKVEETKKRREELIAKYEDWKSQGFNIEPLSDILDKELSEMETAFETFEKDLNQLLELQKKMGVKLSPKEKAKVETPVEETGSEPEEPEEKPAKKDKKSGKEQPTPDEEMGKSGLEIIPEYSFDTFVVGASNRFTHAAALAVAETPAEAYNPLFIYGGVGLGKTHLLNAIGNHIMDHHKKKNIVYTTSEKFTNELINSIRYDKIEEFRNIYRTADVLIIDDIQFLAGKESTQEEFFHTFNSLYTAHKQIVITSDRPPRDIPQLEERLKSRFEGGLITDIQPPSLETKIIILRREAKKVEIEVPDEVMHLIASKVRSNIRELRGALTKISAYSKLVKQDINEDLAKDVLKDFIGERPKQRIPAVDEPEDEPKKPAEEKTISVSDGLSSIEKRLSSLKKKLSPILRKDAKIPVDKEEIAKKEAEKEKSAAKPEEKPAKEPKEEKEVAVESEEELPIPTPVPDEPSEQQDEEAETHLSPEEQAIESSGATEVEDIEEVELAKCGNCGELVPGIAESCPNCGVSFANETYECPMCRATVSGDATRCDNCGAEFEIIEEEPPEVEEKKKKKKKKKK